jgi:DNA-binding NarL/FixJ family response regulator
MLFELYELEVIKAYNGEQALQAVRDHAPSLVIADILGSPPESLEPDVTSGSKIPTRR